MKGICSLNDVRVAVASRKDNPNLFRALQMAR
jgi:hypothetical protein